MACPFCGSEAHLVCLAGEEIDDQIQQGVGVDCRIIPTSGVCQDHWNRQGYVSGILKNGLIEVTFTSPKVDQFLFPDYAVQIT